MHWNYFTRQQNEKYATVIWTKFVSTNRILCLTMLYEPQTEEYDKIWGSRSGDVDGGVLRCDVVWTYRWVSTFHRNILPPSSGLIYTMIIYYELERINKNLRLWNVGLLLGDYMAPYPRRLSSSYSLPREPEIWWDKSCPAGTESLSFNRNLHPIWIMYQLSCQIKIWLEPRTIVCQH
jgi:hypothetical protein